MDGNKALQVTVLCHTTNRYPLQDDPLPQITTHILTFSTTNSNFHSHLHLHSLQPIPPYDTSSGITELSRGYYLEQIKRWLKVIDRSQLMILSFTDLISKTTATMELLAKFLNVNPAR